MVASEGVLTRSIAMPAITLFVLAPGAMPGTSPQGLSRPQQGLQPAAIGRFLTHHACPRFSPQRPGMPRLLVCLKHRAGELQSIPTVTTHQRSAPITTPRTRTIIQTCPAARRGDIDRAGAPVTLFFARSAHAPVRESFRLPHRSTLRATQVSPAQTDRRALWGAQVAACPCRADGTPDPPACAAGS